MPINKPFPTAQDVEIQSGPNPHTWALAEEIPIAFVYNRRNYAVMLATPHDLEDFAIGFSLSEQIVRSIDEINAVDVRTTKFGIELHIDIAAARLERLDLIQRRRNMVGRAGCGLCGLENADSFLETLPRVSETPLELSGELIKIAANAFSERQILNHKTRSVHGASFVDMDADMICVREDVGRHNALDKLLGACISNQVSLNNGFVLMSSRCSYELVEKSARLGVRAIATLSAPTAFAARKSEEANISLYSRFGDTFVKVQNPSGQSV